MMLTSNQVLKVLIKEPLVGSFRFNINPVPASRPRVTRWGTYFNKTYANWKKIAEEQAKEFLFIEKFKYALFVVTVESVIQKARTSKLSTPTPDVDNLAKGPLDAITKAQTVWADDKQIVGLLTTKRFALADEEPHTQVTVYRAEF